MVANPAYFEDAAPSAAFDLLAGLNAPQREAVIRTEGPLLLLAGAGSGKTRVITRRIAYLIQQGVSPARILAVTFTNKAADEMRGRVLDLLADAGLDRSRAPMLSTFHSFCAWLLRRHIAELGAGYNTHFSIYDQADSTRQVRLCLKELGYTTKEADPREIQARISGAKNRGFDARLFRETTSDSAPFLVQVTARVFELYAQRLKSDNALDFDDLLLKALELLRTHSHLRDLYSAQRFTHVLVDEFQDTNGVQFALLKYLTGYHRNICVVGDESQSIYKFRGSDISIILNFRQHFQDAALIRLEQNYRSTRTIVSAANAVIANNRDRIEKTLFTVNPNGDRVFLYNAYDGEDEAAFAASEIQHWHRARPDDHIAILYRTNAQSRAFEEALRRRAMPYAIVGGISFYEREEIKDAMAYVRLGANPHDGAAFDRVINTPARGLGKKCVAAIAAASLSLGKSKWDTLAEVLDGPAPLLKLAPRARNSMILFRALINKIARIAASGHVSAVVKAAIGETGYGAMLSAEHSEEADGRLRNLHELVTAATDYDGAEDGLQQFIDHAALVCDQDGYDENAIVTLMTIHAAKGLEFPVVFLAGMEEGLFPHKRSVGDPAEIEEERRLCYVGVTRAQVRLYVSYANQRRIYGNLLEARPSRFIDEIPAEHTEYLS